VNLALVLFVVVVIALAVGLVILWDRLVGTALMGVVAGAGWMVVQSKGRWWLWPVVVVAVFGVIAAFVVAVLIS